MTTNLALFASLAAVALVGCSKSSSKGSSTAAPENPPPRRNTAESLGIMSESAEGYAQAPAPTAPAAPAQPAAQENPPPATEAPQGIRRTLTAADGRKVEAELLARGEGTVKFRRLSDAQEFVFPLEKLSSEDQSFIRESALPVIAAR